MLTSDGNWPPEIDIIERFTSYPQDYIATTVHTRSNTPGFIYSGQAWLPDGPPHYQRFYSIFHSGDADPSNGFHLYGMEWTPDTITYYYDRQLVVTMVTPADLKDGRPMYLLLNFAADFNTTTWPGLTPVKMEIDWIRVWGMPVAPAPPIDGPSPWDGEWDTPGASIWDSGASLWDNG
jgi:beta-glucanase (GH16 family)